MLRRLLPRPVTMTKSLGRSEARGDLCVARVMLFHARTSWRSTYLVGERELELDDLRE